MVLIKEGSMVKLARRKTSSSGSRRITDTPLLVQSRHVTLAHGKVCWGNLQTAKGASILSKIKKAICDAKVFAERKQVGTIIYLTRKGIDDPMPIYQVKYGTDGRLFCSWKANPVADYWKRKLGQGYSQKR
tara:strand:- start:1306 stop:1698 length:393 start_codon:yes stop_codon:yes gene_type:complete